MTDSNLLNEVARIIDPQAFERHTSAYDHNSWEWSGRRDLALSKASQVLVLVEGWSNSAQSRPGCDDSASRDASAGSEPSAAPQLGYYCPACQAIPQAGYCNLAGCPTAPGVKP